MKITSLFIMAAILICSCRPKTTVPGLNNLVTTDTTRVDEKVDTKNVSRRELIVGKWKITGALPEPSELEKNDMLKLILEFTKEGKLFVTEKGKKEEAATINFSFDENYIISRETGHENKVDTILIQELNIKRMVLVSTKDNKTLIAERVD